MDRRSLDERAPLLPRLGSTSRSQPASVAPRGGNGGDCDHHAQFCHLAGVKPINHPPDEDHKPHPHSLYARAVSRRRTQSRTYWFTATLINSLLLSQIVLGAALTGLGASNSSRILITVFGALNTIIAGVIAFLKSRGQPVRARMFRDDLARVVDEIENSAVMWYGITASAHGYDAIDTEDQVTVRGEIARLTRLYDKAVKTNTMNDPDMYSAGTGDSYSAGLKKNFGAVPPPAGASALPPAPSEAPPAPAAAPTPAPEPSPAAAADPKDAKAPEPPTEPAAAPTESAGSATPEEKTHQNGASNPEASPTEEGKGKEVATASASAASTPSAAPTSPPVPVVAHVEDDPDASPATAARLPKKEDSQKSEKTLIGNDEKS